jgi:hypothetical protein
VSPRIVRTVAAVVGASATMLAPVGQVDARTVPYQDARGDVARLDLTTGRVTPAPDQSNGDITRARFGYARMVSAVVEFADLQRTGLYRRDVLHITTDDGLRRTVTLRSESGHWAGTAAMTTRDGGEVRCPGLLHTVDYEADSVTVQVPRTCLSTPRWVRVGFASVTLTPSDAVSATMTTDDALRDRPISIADRSWELSTRIPGSGPPVRRER